MRETMRCLHLLLSSSLILSACGLSNGQSIEPIKLTNTLLTATASISSTPRPTIGLTRTPTFLPTSTLSPSWTPLPTLPANDADRQFLSWMHGSPDCQFPCWAEITPGETSWEEAIHLLAPVIDLQTTNDSTRCRFDECSILSWDHESGDDPFYGEIYSKDDIVYSISIEGDQVVQDLSLESVLEKHGIPENAFIVTSPYGLAGDPPMFFLYLLFAKSKFVIEYIWEAQITSESILACGRPEGFSLGIVAIGEDQWDRDEIYRTGSQLDVFTTRSEELRPIEDVTAMTAQGLYWEILENDPSFCIVTPLEHWR